MIRTFFNFFHKSKERLKAAVSNFESLLCNVSVKNFVVLAFLADVVIALVTEILMFSKIILPYAVDCFIVEIF